jgi:uncharacterized membrane protein
MRVMTDLVFSALTFAAALGCGLIAGVFFAFSSFVMAALHRLPPAQGIAAMQSINLVVINPLFLGTFLGTAAACAVAAARSLLAWDRPGAACALGGSLAYLAGTFLVTMVFNVPRNNVLAAVDPASGDSVATWNGYVRGWTAWNHVRTVAALVAAGLLTWAGWR